MSRKFLVVSLLFGSKCRPYVLVSAFVMGSTFVQFLVCPTSVPQAHPFVKVWGDVPTVPCGSGGATEDAGVENAIRSKMHGWKMHEQASRMEKQNRFNTLIDP